MRTVLITALLLLIVALAFLNDRINTTSSSGRQKPSAAALQTLPGKLSGHDMETALATDLQPEVTVNDPATADFRVTVGWVFDDSSQPDPTALIRALQTIKRFAGMTFGRMSVQTVDLDVPMQNRSPAARKLTRLGMAINGQTTVLINGKRADLSDNPGEGNLTQQQLIAYFSHFQFQRNQGAAPSSPSRDHRR